MAAPLDLHIRRQIFKRMQRGDTPAEIAFAFCLAARSVRQLCQRFRELGPESLEPSYHRPEAAGFAGMIQNALRLREQHPTWGAAYILLQLRKRHPDRADLPSERTLQRRLREAEQPPAPPGRKAPSVRALATRPHEVWQMDAVEQCPLKTGKKNLLAPVGRRVQRRRVGNGRVPAVRVRSSAGVGSGRRFTSAFSALGHARTTARRQRHPVGQLERPADPVRLMGRWPGHRLALERPEVSAAESENRTGTRHGQTLGGAAAVPQRSGVATAR
jgi:Helix-turn-helix domain